MIFAEGKIMQFKKFLSFVLCMTLILGTVVFGTVFASALDLSGNCGVPGSTVQWYLYMSSGVLKIYGSGKMLDYADEDGNRAPWSAISSSIKAIVIDNEVTYIGRQAFSKCNNVVPVVIGSAVEKIANLAFGECSVTSVEFVSDSKLKVIGPSAFAFCKNLTSITLPPSLQEIGGDAFFDCFNLTSITLPRSLKEIGGDAFHDCFNLTSITLPRSLEKIGDEAFSTCRILSEVNVMFTQDEWNSKVQLGRDVFPETAQLKFHSHDTSGNWKKTSDYHYKYCDECGAYLLQDNHNWVDGEIIKEPGYIEDGERRIICDVCGAKSARSVPKLECNLLRFYSQENSDYKTNVTVRFHVPGVPAGAKVFIDGKEVSPQNDYYSLYIGQLTETYKGDVEIRIDDTVIQKRDYTVTVASGFFQNLKSWFSNFLFNGFKWKNVTINYGN